MAEKEKAETAQPADLGQLARLVRSPDAESLVAPLAAENRASGAKKEWQPPTCERVSPPEDPPIRTIGMPLFELPPCSNCEKFLAPVFRVLDLRFGAVNAREVAGLALAFNFPLRLAEVFASRDSVEITDDPRLADRLYLCQECFTSDLNLAVLIERVQHREARRARAAGDR